MKKLLTLSLLLLFSVDVFADAIPIDFDCSVKNFFRTSEDRNDEFMNSNLKKRFLISIGEQEVIVTSISDAFKSSITKFKIFHKEGDGLGSVRARSQEILTQTIVINPESGDATISLQQSFFINSWLLACNKQ